MTKNKFAVKRGAEEAVKTAKTRRYGIKEDMPENDFESAEREREEFENEKKSYLAEKLEFHAKKALSEEGLPVSFAKLLCGGDEEETLENIFLFKEEFTKAIETALSKKLKGSTPRTAAGEVTFDSFLSGFGN